MGADEKGTEIEEIPPMFELEMTDSSGTYVVRDLVPLTRTRQGPFVSPPYTTKAREDVTQSIVGAPRRGTRGNARLCLDWTALCAEEAQSGWMGGRTGN